MNKQERLINARERYRAISMVNPHEKTREELAELEAEYEMAWEELKDAIRDAEWTVRK